jgi:hypothetical protein
LSWLLQTPSLLLVLSAVGLAVGLALRFSAYRDWSSLVFTLTVLPVLLALLVQIVASLRRGEVGLDIVAALSMSAALIFGEQLAAAVVALMYAGGQYLESFAARRARREMTALLSRVPRTARRHRDGRLEEISLEQVRPGDRLLWYTTTGWMMWNFLVGSLLVGGTAVLVDGSPSHPDLGRLWGLAASGHVTHLGASAAFLMACRKAGLTPRRDHDLSPLRVIGSTGSPLPVDGFRWVYEAVGRDIRLDSLSGGTDVVSAFVGGSPTLPVRAGELSCRYLGARVEAFGEDGLPVPAGQTGELVVTAPLPSMPVRFWNDPDGRRYRESYFERFPGVWRHGDWIRFTASGTTMARNSCLRLETIRS